MNWRVQITRSAQKELASLPQDLQRRVAKSLLALEGNPFPHGSQKLKNRDGWRIRVGDYRILYFVDSAAKVVTIGVIGHRREVYRE